MQVYNDHTEEEHTAECDPQSEETFKLFLTDQISFYFSPNMPCPAAKADLVYLGPVISAMALKEQKVTVNVMGQTIKKEEQMDQDQGAKS